MQRHGVGSALGIRRMRLHRHGTGQSLGLLLCIYQAFWTTCCMVVVVVFVHVPVLPFIESCKGLAACLAASFYPELLIEVPMSLFRVSSFPALASRARNTNSKIRLFPMNSGGMNPLMPMAASHQDERSMVMVPPPRGRRRTSTMHEHYQDSFSAGLSPPPDLSGRCYYLRSGPPTFSSPSAPRM